ncbi:carbohydrate-binding module family 18 protein [Piromyces sp. E2]|nr:carbohydrate-binding module family 18 protein [Piromyces sp. E2]|eukprot:OUM63713.1 carbohydrate-binding module family 18 protein [Piromyces sp. E2]
MKFLLPITLLASSLLVNVEAARWKPKPGLTWDYLLSGNENDIKISDKDVVTFDLEYAEAMVPVLHKKHQKAICYFSAGTTDDKPDKQKFVDAGLVIKSGKDNGWEQKKLQPLLRDRFRRAYKYKCDAVEVDGLDIHEYHPEFTKDDTLTFTKWLVETGHQENISVGLKNLPSLASKLEPYYDFAVVENCASNKECKYFNVFTKNKKAVFVVHYKNEGWRLSGSKLKTLIDEQKNNNFTCVISYLNLQNHSINYNCNTGAELKCRSKAKRFIDESSTDSSSENEESYDINDDNDIIDIPSERCGENYGSCSDGQCCSKYGWCGTSNEYCGVGCQKEFGECLNASRNDRF